MSISQGDGTDALSSIEAGLLFGGSSAINNRNTAFIFERKGLFHLGIPHDSNDETHFLGMVYGKFKEVIELYEP